MQLIQSPVLAANYFSSMDDLPFSAEEYSRFKFGCKTISRKFGELLANAFIAAHTFDETQIVVISSPYSFIPTATFAMKDYFIKNLNLFLIKHNLPVVQETKIIRTISYKEDYGTLNKAERLALIEKDQFHIDREFVKGKFCLFLDDVKITGSHQIVVERMIEKYALECNYMFLYFGELIGESTHPNIENELNYAYVKTLRELNQIIQSGDFILNTRTTKYILNYYPRDCKEFLEYQSKHFIDNLYHQAIGNSYHTELMYKINFKILELRLQELNASSWKIY